MSVIVKGMEIPENCIKCPLQFGGWCYASPPEIDERVAPTVDEAWEQGKPDWCPLVALPDHHGRLMDADALCEDLFERWSVAETRKEDLIKAVMADVVTPIIACQPTIVEAEGDES